MIGDRQNSCAINGDIAETGTGIVLTWHRSGTSTSCLGLLSFCLDWRWWPEEVVQGCGLCYTDN